MHNAFLARTGLNTGIVGRALERLVEEVIVDSVYYDNKQPNSYPEPVDVAFPPAFTLQHSEPV